MSQPQVRTMAAGQPLVGTMVASQSLKRMTVTVRLMNLVVMVWSMLRSQENQKAKIWLSSKNCLSQENPKAKNRKNYQKVKIHRILTLWKPNQTS